MTREDIIRMAREAGWPDSLIAPVIMAKLSCFAVLVAAAEREAHTRKLEERYLTDEIIANLWHQNGGYHHHFARAIERYLKGQK
jgi:hypothetical protein